MWGVQSNLLTLDKYSSWRLGRVVPMIRSAVRTTLRSLLWLDLVAELNQTVIDVQRTDSMIAEQNFFSNSYGRLNFLRWRRMSRPLLGFFHNGVYVIVPLQVLGDGGAQEPEWLHCSHSAIHDGKWGVSPEVHDHLHCLSMFSTSLLRLHQTASSLTSCL